MLSEPQASTPQRLDLTDATGLIRARATIDGPNSVVCDRGGHARIAVGLGEAGLFVNVHDPGREEPRAGLIMLESDPDPQVYIRDRAGQVVQVPVAEILPTLADRLFSSPN